MASRGHLFRPITDETGAVQYDAVVTVQDATTGGRLTQTLWSGPLTQTASQPNPLSATQGYIDLWLDQPVRVALLIQSPGRADALVYQDVFPAGQEVVRTDYPFVITNAPTNGQALIATGPTTASFQNPPLAPPSGAVAPHQHPGTGGNSVALGAGTVAPGLGSTAVGVASAASADYATAYGESAQATAQGATAVGVSSAASATDALAVGYQSIASGSGSAAVGYQANASAGSAVAIGPMSASSGQGGVAIGTSSSAGGVDSVAVGASAVASGQNAAAVGTSATASYDRSVAVGPGAATTGADQVVLGASTATVIVPGNLISQGPSQLGSSNSTVGFFGSAGTVKQVVTGSTGGNAVLQELLTYLDAIGLITNSSTS